MNGNTQTPNFFPPPSIWSRIRPGRCRPVLLCGQRVMVSPPSWSPLRTLSESLPAPWVRATLKTINMLGCSKHIRLAKSNLGTKITKSWFWLWCWDLAFLRITENWSQNVKCLLLQLYWLWTTMVPLPHNQSVWNEGYRNLIKLYCNFPYVYTFFFSLGERAQSFHQILEEIQDSRKFKGNWLILRPNAFLLVSDSLRY